MGDTNSSAMATSRRGLLRASALAGGGVLLAAGGLELVSPRIWRDPLPIEPNGSYWARSQAPRNPPLERDIEVDVAVLGGGLTGLSSAYFIRRGSPLKSVAVLEARGCGNGASGRNGAMVLTMTGNTYLNFSASPAMDKQVYDLTAGNVRFLSQLSGETGIDCELAMDGALQVFDTAEQAAAGKAYVARARALGMPVEFWDGGRVAEAIGTRAYRAAVFDPGCGQVHPMKLVNVFKSAAETSGATIYETTRVTAIEEGRSLVLHTAGGPVVRARSLVLASNAFTPDLGFMRNAVLPVREYVAITPPLSDDERAAIGWRNTIPFNDARTEVFYLGMTRDGRVHIGGGAPRYDFNNGAGSAAIEERALSQLRRELTRLFPKLGGVEFETHWHGIVDWAIDEAPSVGRTGRYGNIFYGLGYSGHGVNLTSVFGRIIADMEAGLEDKWTRYPFVNTHFHYVPNEPFRWLAAKAGLGWYGLIGG